MGTGEDWLPIAEVLSQDFYCLLPDLPGHGNTPLDAAPGYESWSAALQKMLLSHDIEQTTLVGYSLGGRLALHFSLTYPEIVTRLVLESANPGIGDPNERQKRIEWDETLSERILHEGLGAFLNTWYDLPLFESLNHHPGLKAKLRRERIRQSPQDVAAVLGALSPGRQPDLWPHLSRVQVPTLLIAGRLDQKYMGLLGEMNRVIPNSHFVLLDGCGHNVHLEDPDRYMEELQDWLIKTADHLQLG